MLDLKFPESPLRITCLGAHPDDIEIGCGATLLTLAANRQLEVTSLVATGTTDRKEEAIKAADAFVPGHSVDVRFLGMRDGHLPSEWSALKDGLQAVAAEAPADVIFAPGRHDAHQDHRTIAELVPTVWRDSIVLSYEIPKWDGDLGPVTHYVPVDEDAARQKVDLLSKCFPSQRGRDWWDEEVFLGLMRLRGIECHTRYAEGFVAAKTAIGI